MSTTNVRDAPRRKHRNAEERAAVRDDVLKQLEVLESGLRLQVDAAAKLPADVAARAASGAEAMARLRADLDRFVALAEQGHVGELRGSAELPSMKKRVEYVLPGRRVVKHEVRVRPLDGSRSSSGAAGGRSSSGTSSSRQTPAVFGPATKL